MERGENRTEMKKSKIPLSNKMDRIVGAEGLRRERGRDRMVALRIIERAFRRSPWIKNVQKTRRHRGVAIRPAAEGVSL